MHCFNILHNVQPRRFILHTTHAKLFHSMVDTFGSMVRREGRTWREKGQSLQMGWERYWEGSNCAGSADNGSSNMRTEQCLRNEEADSYKYVKS